MRSFDGTTVKSDFGAHEAQRASETAVLGRMNGMTAGVCLMVSGSRIWEA